MSGIRHWKIPTENRRNSFDKVVVFRHGDLNGITSGLIALLQFPGSPFYFSGPSQIHQDLFCIAKDKLAAAEDSLVKNDFQKFLRALVGYMNEF